MKENPIFSSEDDPIDGLYRISHILRFMIEFARAGNNMKITKNGKEGLVCQLDFIDETVKQIAGTLEEKKLEGKTTE